MNVCCIIVSRGDHDLMPCFETMPENWQKLAWINGSYLESWGPEGFMHDAGVLNLQPVGGYIFPDLSVYGRYEAIKHTSAELIYVQDDDVLVSDPQAIVDALWNAPCQACGGVGRAYPRSNVACPACLTWGTAYAAGEVCANMPPEFRHDGYTDSCLVGFGACFHRDAPARAFERWYAAEKPEGTNGEWGWISRTCDVIFTTLTPRVLVDVPKVNREFAEDASRMYRQPGHVEERARMLELARCVRDA